MVITGIIRPPPEIRAVADRTASYVAKNGRAFEARILKSEKGKTPKFAFLQHTSPFHSYYEDRISFYENGGVDDDNDDNGGGDSGKKKMNKDDDTKGDSTSSSNKKTAPPPSTTTKSDNNNNNNYVVVRKKDRKQKASAMDPIARAILDQRAKIVDARIRQEKEMTMMEKEGANNNNNNDDDGNNENNNKIGGGTEGGDDPIIMTSATTDLSVPKRVTHHHPSSNKKNNTTFPLRPPVPFEFVSVVPPANLSPTDIETMQLVAQFTALDGRGGTFLKQLTMREWNNPDFRFCQPRHGHFAYFSALVDSYRRIIQDWTTAASEKETATAATAAESSSKKATSPTIIEGQSKTSSSSSSSSPVYPNSVQAVLADAAFRAEYEREMEERRSKQQEQEEGEVITIDWHDFIVVETIEFPSDEQIEVLAMLSPPPPLVAGGATTTTAKVSATTAPAAVDGVASRVNDNNDMEESDDGGGDHDDDEEEEAIRVVPTYTPKVVTATSLSEARAIDPITGKSIPLADMPEHMRIQLLDPKWAEERKKFQEKQKDSNLVGGDAIVSNISRFAQGTGGGGRGGDKSGDDGVGSSIMSDNNPKRRLEEANRIIRDQQQPQSMVYPAVATAPSAAAATSGIPVHTEPPAKRQRMAMNLPPPGPPSRTLPPLPPATNNMNMPSGGFPDIPPPTVTTAPPVPGVPPAAPPVTMDQPGIDMLSDMGFPSSGIDGDGTMSGTTLKTELLSEEEFVKTLPNPEVTLMIRIPNDPTQMAWNFYGQILTLKVDVMTKVKDVAAELSKQHLNGLAANKVQLINPRGGFLNNNKTLAELNIGPTVTLDMKTKQRGGRK